LNELTDVVSDTALYAPFALLPGANPWLLGTVIVLAIISELAGTVAVMTGASRRYDGPMGKSDRAFVFGLLGLLVGSGVAPGHWLNWAWAALAVLLAVTIVNRIRGGLAELQRT
jgi:CDP-diacylglycerol--glycerol-3-phosphate 3-phosphatidyltransferase